MSQKTLLVVATKHPCPVEGRKRGRIDPKTGRDRDMIYPDEPREVPNTLFYRRRIRSVDLAIVEAKKAKGDR